ncbi:hypothetical protein HY256_01625 [Candidatus Sumerlaeota bacterium]|nr:hypothetical protein [Candidatus Sumerlaeota bacterium]
MDAPKETALVPIPVKFPFWAKWIFPAIPNVSENPLYFRFAGLRYTKKPRRFTFIPRWPLEFKISFELFLFWFFGTGFRLGLLFVAQVVGLIFVGFLFDEMMRSAAAGIEALFGQILVFHLLNWTQGSQLIAMACIFTIDGGLRLSAFLANFASKPWGEDLHLSSLSPSDYDFPIRWTLLRTEVSWTWLIVSIALGFYAFSGFLAYSMDSQQLALGPSVLWLLCVGGIALYPLLLLDILLWISMKQAYLIHWLPSAIQKYGTNMRKEIAYGYVQFLFVSSALFIPGGMCVFTVSYFAFDLIASSPFMTVGFMFFDILLFHAVTFPLAMMHIRNLHLRTDGHIGAAIRALRALR